jgi:hypothetical protein
MNSASENRAGSVALLVLGFFIALTCVSAIGAAASLVIMTPDERTPRGGDCVVVAWNTGMIYCQGAKPGEGSKPMIFSPSVIARASAGESVR